MTEHCAVVVVGLPRKDLSETDLLHLKDFTLEEYCPMGLPNMSHNIIGLEYASTGSYSNEEFEWHEWVTEKLKEQFFALTGKDAKIYLTVKEY